MFNIDVVQLKSCINRDKCVIMASIIFLYFAHELFDAFSNVLNIFALFNSEIQFMILLTSSGNSKVMTATPNLCKTTLKHIKNFEHSTRTTIQSPNEAKHDFKNYSDHVTVTVSAE